MAFASKTFTDIVMTTPIFFQGLMVYITSTVGYSFMDKYFLVKGFGFYFLYLFAWALLLVFLRRIIMSPYNRVFSLWVILYHTIAGMKLWKSFVSSINNSMGQMVAPSNIGIFSHYSGIVFLLFYAGLIHHFSKSCDGQWS
ncbi:MAG: hypothetical protein KC646_15775 [Candidatus Cloacimonetes bacterium]|nr:hypothetical protein [Candidatus Cloacimonadota bacterium]